MNAPDLSFLSREQAEFLEDCLGRAVASFMNEVQNAKLRRDRAQAGTRYADEQDWEIRKWSDDLERARRFYEAAHFVRLSKRKAA